MKRQYLVAFFALALCFVVRPASAQRLEDGEIKFDAVEKPVRPLIRQLFKGEVQAEPANKDHQTAASIAAKRALYEIVWNQDASRRALEAKSALEREKLQNKLNSVVEDFDGQLGSLSSPKLRANTAAFQSLFCRKIVDTVTELFEAQPSDVKPIALVNASRCLSLIPERPRRNNAPESVERWIEDVAPRLDKGTGDHLVSVCLQLMEKPSCKDGMRYYLLKTIATTLSFPSKTPIVKSETAEKAFAVATKLIEEKKIYPKATPRQEVEGYKMLRLQAVAVLAQAKVPVINATNRPAMVLLRVCGGDVSIVPSPRLDERMEAAIGLCKMSNAKSPSYNADYAAGWIGAFIALYAAEYNLNREAVIPSRARPWKIQAVRLNEALDELKASSKDKYVQDVIAQCRPVVNKMEANQDAGANVLQDWIGANEPPNKSLFAKDEKAVVTLPMAKE